MKHKLIRKYIYAKSNQHTMKRVAILTTLLLSATLITRAQDKAKPQDTEFYSPIPPVVTPGASFSDAPSDAIVLFDGRNLDQWINTKDLPKQAGRWPIM